MSKQKTTAIEKPKPETKPAAVTTFAESQRENAPEETADDLARKALAGTTEQKENAEPLSTDAQAKAPGTPANEVRDKAGELFNPELHAVKSDGSPSFAKSGVFRRKRGTGGSRVAVPAANALPPDEARRIAEANAQAAEEQKRRKAAIAAGGIAEIIFKSGYMLGGDEWLPIKNDEKQIDERRDMHTAWAEYCYARGVEDIPPGLLVAFVCSAYALPRFAGPETQKRVGAFATFVKRGKLWFENWRLKRGNNAARIANRNDGERKDNASEGDSGGTKEK